MKKVSVWKKITLCAASLCLLEVSVAFTAQTNTIIHPRRPTSARPQHTTTVLHENPLDRFTNPKIDDPWLPLTEAGLAQVAAPTLQLFLLVAADSPYPSWARPLFDPTFAQRGAFLAPTLIHGAELACCWLLGCLAAKGWEQVSYQGSFAEVTVATIKAGAFACGVLILATQFDLYQEMGGYVQLGDSPETDLRIYRALVEVTNDIFFEFVTLLSWRLYRSTVRQYYE